MGDQAGGDVDESPTPRPGGSAGRNRVPTVCDQIHREHDPETAAFFNLVPARTASPRRPGPRPLGRCPSPAIVRDRHEPRQGMDLQAKALEWDFSLKLPEDFLLVEDRTSMAHSLESRVPFLDNEMIDLA
ncbi:MAG: asparagine synthase-related protein, partial [Bradymonadaceae bacterium]